MRRRGVAMNASSAREFDVDRPHSPNHTIKVLHLDPAAGRVAEDAVLAELADAARRLPVLRRQPHVHRVGGCWWTEPAAVDVRAHLTCRSIAAAEHDTVIAELLGTQLPPGGPLWRAVLLDTPDRQSLVLLAHHGLLDGRVTALLLDAMFGAHRPTMPLESADLPSRLRAAATWPARMVALAVRGARSARARRGMPELSVIDHAFAARGGPWNAPVRSPRRGYAELSFDLATFTAAARALGASFTELVVAATGGALHALDPAGDDHVAVLPVDVHRPPDPPLDGNRSTVIFVSTGNREPDAAARLRSVVASSGAAKAVTRAGDARVMSDGLVGRTPLEAVRLAAAAVMRRRGRTTAALVVSTVRGPVGPLTVGGATVTEIVSGGVLQSDLGLNVTAWSACGRVTLSVVARPEFLDVARAGEALGAAVEEYLALAADGR